MTKLPLTNLPARTYIALIGREQEVSNICTNFASSPDDIHTNILIYGLSGVGKTSVALEVGHYFLQHYNTLDLHGRFDGIIWVSAQPAVLTADGFTNLAYPSRTLSEIVTVIAVTLEQQEVLKAPLEDQVPLVLKALSDRRCLLIVDNLETLVDERALGFLRQVPSQTCVLMTSRIRIDMGIQMHMEPLDQESGLQLITEIAKQRQVSVTQSQGKQLFLSTGGIPLGIVWAIALIDHGYNPDNIINSLAEAQRESLARVHADILNYCFDRLWELIQGQASEKLLLSLIYFPGGASKTAIEYTSSFEGQDTSGDDGLILLEKLCLVEKSNNRYRILPLTRAYITTKLITNLENESEIHIRWAEYLSRYVKQSLRFDTWEQVFERLDIERENIFELFKWASTRPQSFMWFHAAVILYDIIYYLYSRGYWLIILSNRDWAAQSLLQQSLIEEYLVVFLSWSLRIFISQRENAKIAACFESVEQTLNSLGENDNLQFYQAIVRFNRASILRRSGNYAGAIEELHNAINTFHELEHAEWEAGAVNRLGNTLSVMQQYEEAENAYQQVERLATSSPPSHWTHEMTGQSKGNLGILANRLGNYNRAIRLLMECEHYIAQQTDRAVLYMELAIAYYHRDNYFTSINYAKKAQELADGVGLVAPIAESDFEWEATSLPRLRSARFLILRSVLTRLGIRLTRI